MPIVHKKLRLEAEPIEATIDQDRHRKTWFVSLNFRVLDTATDKPIGLVPRRDDVRGIPPRTRRSTTVSTELVAW